MPNYRRWHDAGGTYFFTVVAYRHRRILDQPLARHCLRGAMASVRRETPIDMFACVLLPDHLHCIWTLPDVDDNFSARWANIKRRFTQSYLKAGGHELPVSTNRRKHHERGVWQPCFWEHRIRNERELLAYRDYIHLNPVRHGLVPEPTAWPWSSVHRHLDTSMLAPDWTAWSPIKAEVASE